MTINARFYGHTTVSLVNIHNYPKELYSAYWEINVEGDPDTPGSWVWRTRLFSYDEPNKIETEQQGGADTREEADTLAQTFVLDNIENYKRPSPISRLTTV